MIKGRNFFDQPVKNNLITYDNIGKIATGQRDDNTTDCLLDTYYFNNYYKMISIDLSKQTLSNTANHYYWKSRLKWKQSNVFHYWTSKRNHFIFLTRNC